jgi:hypothetical protein
MTNPIRIPLLVALTVILGAGLYVSTTAPTAALAATWTPPAATGCFVPADAYLIDWQTQFGTAGRDTTFAPAWNDYPNGVFRFRVAAYAFQRDGNGNVTGWRIGRPLSGTGCAISPTDTLWGQWSGWATNGTPGQPSAPIFGAVLK